MVTGEEDKEVLKDEGFPMEEGEEEAVEVGEKSTRVCIKSAQNAQIN